MEGVTIGNGAIVAAGAIVTHDLEPYEKLSSLLILLMEDAWDDAQMQSTSDTLDIQAIKDYLDENFKKRISLDNLAGSFYLNKYYLMKLFKDRYGMTINAYLNQMRVTWVKQQLRFTDKTVEMLAAELQIDVMDVQRGQLVEHMLERTKILPDVSHDGLHRLLDVDLGNAGCFILRAFPHPDHFRCCRPDRRRVPRRSSGSSAPPADPRPGCG